MKTQKTMTFSMAIRADEPSANGVIFPRAVLEKAIAEAQQKLNDGKLYLSIGEPRSDGVIGFESTVGRAATITMERDGAVGVVCEIFNRAPATSVVAALLEQGIELALWPIIKCTCDQSTKVVTGTQDLSGFTFVPKNKETPEKEQGHGSSEQ